MSLISFYVKCLFYSFTTCAEPQGTHKEIQDAGKMSYCDDVCAYMSPCIYAYECICMRVSLHIFVCVYWCIWRHTYVYVCTSLFFECLIMFLFTTWLDSSFHLASCIKIWSIYFDYGGLETTWTSWLLLLNLPSYLWDVLDTEV